VFLAPSTELQQGNTRLWDRHAVGQDDDHGVDVINLGDLVIGGYREAKQEDKPPKGLQF
jgi:hypothetical protein